MTRTRLSSRSIVAACLLTTLAFASRRAFASPELKIEDVNVQNAARPNERVCIFYRTASSSRVHAEVVWGTEPGTYTHTTALLTKASGVRAFATPIHVPDLPCTIHFRIHAHNDQGTVTESAEHSFAVKYPPLPPGALGFVVNPHEKIPDATGASLTATIDVPETGHIMRVEARVDITHPRRGDLLVALVSPSGTRVVLHTPSGDVTPNLRGTYGDGMTGDLVSAQDLAVLQGESFKGTWKLEVTDEVKHDQGTLDAFGLNVFIDEANGPKSPDEALPDMQMEPPTQISIDTSSGPKQLQFSTTFANVGKGPLELTGKWDSKHTILSAYQRIYEEVKDAQGHFKKFQFVREQLVGEFVADYDGDFHFADWAHYVLLDESFKPAKGAIDNLKMTFAIEDIDHVDPHLPGSPASNVYTGSQWLQGISVGWSDTYGAGLDGQSIDITHTPDGVYYLVLQGSRILDECNADKTNNDSAAKVKIQGDNVTVLATYTGARFHALESNKGVAFKANVQPIFDAHCIQCHKTHGAIAPFSLESDRSWQSIVNVASLENPMLDRVKPDNLAASYLWHKLKGTQSSVGGSGQDMPPGGPLDAADLATIQQWITSGAKDD